MVITIVGWYGTETIGDRAILVGLIDILSELNPSLEINLASLYPFYSERAIMEDTSFIHEISQDCKVSVFDVRDEKIAKKNINNSDMVMMGGGPLTEIYELDYILSCFKYAKRNGVHTGLIGVGGGPINNKSFLKMVGKIISLSDLIITRDAESKKFIQNNYNYSGTIITSRDPAILPTFKNIKIEKKYANTIVVNLRKYPFGSAETRKEINDYLITYLKNLLNTTDKEVLLLSNHYFFIGGDDREFYFEISEYINSGKLHIQKTPLSLKEVLTIIKSADICIGMRYHAILFQTYLNGNNYILDYTDPNDGKTISFIRTLDGGVQFYKDRYISLHRLNGKRNLIHSFSEKRYSVNAEDYHQIKKEYINALKSFLDFSR